MFVLKEMLPSYHKWRYNSHGVREQIGKEAGQEGLRAPLFPEPLLPLPDQGASCVAASLLSYVPGCLILELIHAILNLCPEMDLHNRWE